jgi:hypothetical protein
MNEDKELAQFIMRVLLFATILLIAAIQLSP